MVLRRQFRPPLSIAMRPPAAPRFGEFITEFQTSDRITAQYERDYEFIPQRFAIARGITIPVAGYNLETVRVGQRIGGVRPFLWRAPRDRHAHRRPGERFDSETSEERDPARRENHSGPQSQRKPAHRIEADQAE